MIDESLSAGDLDREYDTRISVPDLPSWVAGKSQHSAIARESAHAYREHEYGDHPLQRLDFFPAPHAPANAPLLVFIHGGYWRALDKSFFSYLAPAWTAAGVAVAILNYRLAPDVSMTSIVDDVRTAVALIWRKAYALGADRNRIVIAGHSAGGHLTAMMLATDFSRRAADLPCALACGAVSVSALNDLAPLARAPFLGPVLRLTPEEIETYSPARLKPAGSTPLITCVGAEETRSMHMQNSLVRHWPSWREDVPAPGLHHLTVIDQLGIPDTPLFNATRNLFALSDT